MAVKLMSVNEVCRELYGKLRDLGAEEYEIDEIESVVLEILQRFHDEWEAVKNGL